jgi:hypothetical protein
MIYLTGDTHAAQIRRLNTSNCPAKAKDYVIILGDFGLVWSGSKEEKYWLDWLSDKPFSTLFVDGNHENHVMLQELKEQKKFGSIVGRVRHNVFHLKRGHIYDIEGSSFLAFGGASSIDKASRKEWISWWPQEVPSYSEYNTCMDNLALRDNNVDYILSHTLPKEASDKYLSIMNYDRTMVDPTENMLSEIVSVTKFKKLYCGHWHNNITIDKFRILYEDIVKLGE